METTNYLEKFYNALYSSLIKRYKKVKNKSCDMKVKSKDYDMNLLILDN